MLGLNAGIAARIRTWRKPPPTVLEVRSRQRSSADRRCGIAVPALRHCDTFVTLFIKVRWARRAAKLPSIRLPVLHS